MRIVLYSDVDMEPITVFDMAPQMIEYFERHRVVTFPVIEPPMTAAYSSKTITPPILKTVDMWRELIIRNGQQHWLYFTRQDENAMLLKAAFLPGQQHVINRMEDMIKLLAESIFR